LTILHDLKRGKLMDSILKDKIEFLGKQYFSLDFITAFISNIDLLAPNPDKYFFQIVQKQELPTMEFGCIANKIIIDVTSSTDKTITAVMRTSSMTTIELTEDKNSTELRIALPTIYGFLYKAANDDSRKELRKYAEYLQINLLDG
jgi:hypothetical protein